VEVGAPGAFDFFVCEKREKPLTFHFL
jgi:hypothetical protein